MQFQFHEDRVLCSTEHIQLKERDFFYRHTEGEDWKKAQWSIVERNKEAQAVVIIPYIRETDQILLIRQFRLPFWKDIIEFPAGLVNSGELISDAAMRELEEETGFRGKLIFQSPPLSISAGMTTEMVTYCVVEVDPSLEYSRNLDPTEDIEVLKVFRGEFFSFCSRMMKKEDCLVDCKVYLMSGIFQSILEDSLCNK